MKYKYLRMFLAPDDGDDVTSVFTDEPTLEEAPSDESVETVVETEVEPEPESAPPAPQQIHIDAAALGRSIGETLRTQAAPPVETPEAIAKRLNAYEASQADVDAVLEGGPGAVAAMNRMLHGKAVHIATIVKASMDERFGEVARTYAPILSEVERRSAEQYITEMVTEHPDLAPVRAQLPGLTNALFTNGLQAVQNNPKETRKVIASAIRGMNLIPPGSPPAKPAPKHTGLPSGNSGGAPASVKQKPKGEEDFLSVWGAVNS